MKKVNKLVVLVLALAMVAFAMVGCGGKKDKDNIDIKTPVSQLDALMEVKAGQSDVAIIDSTMAGYLLKSDTSFSDLVIVDIKYDFEKEFYAVAAKKGNDKLINFVNAGIKAQQAQDGAYNTLLTKYGLETRKNLINDEITVAEDWKTQLATQGKVVIGYTLNAPMGIENDDKSVSGFDIELAKAIFADSGVTVETKLIEWDNKEMELNAGTIDLVWNGLTANPDREKTMELSKYYLVNEQAVVVKKSNKDDYTSVDSLKGKKVAVEQGSAGQYAANVIKESFNK